MRRPHPQQVHRSIASANSSPGRWTGGAAGVGAHTDPGEPPRAFHRRSDITAFTAIVRSGAVPATLLYFRDDFARLATARARGLVSAEARKDPDHGPAWAVIIGCVPIAVTGLAFEEVIETTLRSLWFAVHPGHQGRGPSGVMPAAVRDDARARGFAGVVAPVRPSGKHLQSRTPMSEYAVRVRPGDGLPHREGRAGLDGRPRRPHPVHRVPGEDHAVYVEPDVRVRHALDRG